MATPIGMPKLGMTMREGRVVAWACAPGARVEKGAPVVVIESEKSEVEVEATASGVLRHVWVDAGETVPCGTLLAAITDTADEPFDVDAFRRAHDHPDVEALPLPDVPPPLPPAPPGRRDAPPATPAARARARELGLDLAVVRGSGPGGRITREDVDAVATPRGPVRLDVPASGAGDPVVLLPGFGCDASAFAPQAAELARRFRVLGANPRGVGGSAAPLADAYAVADMAEDVAAVLTAPAHLVGASLGAAVAIELALARPDRVRSLVLVTPFVAASSRLLAVLDAWCALAGAAPPDVVARALVPWLFGPRTLGDPKAVERVVRGFADLQRRVPAATLRRQAAGLRAWSGSRAGDLARIAAPTLVVAAADDLLTPGAADLARAIPGAGCTTVADAGHAVALDAPDAVTAAIARHLG